MEKRIELLEYGGEQVLAGVLLHVVEAARPVDGAFDLRDAAERRIEHVRDAILFVDHFDHADAGERAEVEGLASGGWDKTRCGRDKRAGRQGSASITRARNSRR